MRVASHYKCLVCETRHFKCERTPFTPTLFIIHHSLFIIHCNPIGLQKGRIFLRKYHKSAPFSLQLFGEGATGEQGTDAAFQQTQGVTGETAHSLETGTSAPTREATFDSLIRGEYKDLYEQRVSQIVQRRLGKSKEQQEKVDGFLSALAKEYGVEKTDLSALQDAVLGQSKMPSNTHALAGAVYEDLSAQAVALAKVYPSFDLARELENPAFANLLRIPRVDMQTAYELTHKEEILPAVIAAAQRETQKQIAKGMMTGAVRPKENGTASQSTPYVKQDVSTFTPAQMEDICRRVSRGEKIYL